MLLYVYYKKWCIAAFKCRCWDCWDYYSTWELSTMVNLFYKIAIKINAFFDKYVQVGCDHNLIPLLLGEDLYRGSANLCLRKVGEFELFPVGSLALTSLHSLCGCHWLLVSHADCCHGPCWEGTAIFLSSCGARK